MQMQSIKSYTKHAHITDIQAIHIYMYVYICVSVCVVINPVREMRKMLAEDARSQFASSQGARCL